MRVINMIAQLALSVSAHFNGMQAPRWTCSLLWPVPRAKFRGAGRRPVASRKLRRYRG